MQTKELLTIGKLAKLTGIHVKALRYYDRIGILIPTYINPENGYRYYSREHIYLVDMIKLCAEISIPLKDIKDFLALDGTTIDVDSVLDTGIKLVRNKVAEFEKKLNFLEEMKKDVQRNETLRKRKAGLYLTIEPTDYWLEPFTGEIGTNDYHFALNQMFKRVTELGLEAIYEGGIALKVNNQQTEAFIFLTLEENPQNKQYDNVIHLPQTRYLTKITETADIHEVYRSSPELAASKEEVILFELEMYAQQSAEIEQTFEVRMPVKIHDSVS